jgi:luciferase family oxidoreductase group 1
MQHSGFTLSVLDQAPIAEGSDGSQALHNSIDLAKFADRLGYYRYWVSEHHASPALACASPEVLIGPIAAATSHLRVGSGGVMLPHYSPYKVAENFSMLSALYPDRIDLGIGRAAGTDARTTFALQRDRRQASADDFPDQLNELLAYVNGSVPHEHPFSITAGRLPGKPHAPQPFLLGSSPQSGIWAAQLGLPYVFADFINSSGASIAAQYHSTFKPSTTMHPRPHLIVAPWVLCADTDEEARRLATSHLMLIELLHRGTLIPVPAPETAIRYLAQQGRSPTSLPIGRRVIAGSPSTVRPAIEKLVEEYHADEVMIVTITHDHAARKRSYELVADAFGIRESFEESPDVHPGLRHEQTHASIGVD